MSKETLKEAIENYGREVVAETISIVNVSDPDGAYVTFEDMGMYDHCEVIEMLYFA